MSTTTLPLITNVTKYDQQDQLTTIFFECNLLDGRGILARNFQINNYQLNWYYSALGWDKRYSHFTDFWMTACEKTKLDFLFLLLTDDKSTVSAGAKAKVRKEVEIAGVIHFMAEKLKAV